MHPLTARLPIFLLRRSCDAHISTSLVILFPQSSSSVWQTQNCLAAGSSQPDCSPISHSLFFSKMHRNWPIEVWRLGFVCLLWFVPKSSCYLLTGKLLFYLLMIQWIRHWHDLWGCSSRQSLPAKVPDVLCSNFSLHLPSAFLSSLFQYETRCLYPNNPWDSSRPTSSPQSNLSSRPASSASWARSVSRSASQISVLPSVHFVFSNFHFLSSAWTLGISGLLLAQNSVLGCFPLHFLGPNDDRWLMQRYNLHGR